MSDSGEVEVEEEIIEDASVVESVDASQTENGDVGEAVPAMASAMAEAATKDALVEAPGATEEAKEDEKTEDQVTEIEEEQMGARQGSLEEFRDIPVECEGEEGSVKEEAQAPEPPVEEAAPPSEESSPTATRKKVTIEESPPSRQEDSSSPPRKDPSWWKKGKQEDEEVSEEAAVSVEEEKSLDQPKSVEETKEESAKEEPLKPAEEPIIEVPVSADEPPVEVEESKVELAAAEEEKPEESREASPPQERVSRRDKSDFEERARAAAAYEATQPTSTPLARTPTYITYSSWAPPTDYRTTYIPTYGSYIRPHLYYHSEYSTPYTRPTSPYVRTFDQYVRTGPFGQSSYATDRLRTRSRSRDRSRYARSGYYTPAPLRRNREYSLPSRFAQASGPPSAAPSRSGSFVNFMDYIVNTDQNLRRSASRTSIAAEEPPVAKTLFPSPADLISYWYDKRISHLNSYVDRMNEVYDNNVYGYYSRYNTSRPFTGYLHAGLGDRASYSRSFRGHSSELERRLATHKTYLRAYDLSRVPSMTRSIFY